ncbi:TetR/AcrR family transcriptional regulator [Sphingomonas jatrophae]|nr:TetR/AcrR family transcriptional regulator [Sphingomonas jatrophae]
MRKQHPAEESDPATARIVFAAREELLNHGLDHISIDAIAARAGASKTTIYDRFASKASLFAEVLRVTIAEAGGETLPDLSGLNEADALTKIGQWLDRSARSPANLALYRANIVAAVRYPELSEELHALRSRSPGVMAFVDALPARSSVPNLPAEHLAQWLGVLATGGLHYLIGLPEDPTLDRARIDAAAHLFSRGWRSPVTASPAPPRGLEPYASGIAGHPGRTPPDRWKALLVHTARSLLDEGVRGTSVDRLSMETGLSKATIYRRFGDKDGLISATLNNLAEDLAIDLPEMSNDTDIASALITIGSHYQNRFARPDHVAILRLLVREAAQRPELTSRVWHRLTASTHAAFATFLQARADAGELHLTDAVVAAEQFLLLAGGGNRLLTGTGISGDNDAEENVRQLVSFCLRQPVE